MKGLIFNGPRDIRYETYQDPQITDDQNMIIKMEHCSICGSDLHMYHGGHIGTTDYSKPQTPFCTGHEATGEVVELGKGVKNHKIGDRVIVSAGAGCGKCRRCRAGRLNECELALQGKGSAAYGISAVVNGVHAEFMQVYDADVGAVTIPEGMTPEQAILLTDALATGYYGIKSARVEPGDTVAVIGQGPVGLMAAECAMAVGAAKVYAIDPVANRRETSSRFGATPLAPDVATQQIFEDTKGVGVDVVIEAAGIAATVKQAADIVRVGGRISILGILQHDVVVPMQYMQMKNVMVHAGIASPPDAWPALIPLIQAGRIKGDGVFTHQFSLSDGSEAFRMFDAHEDGVMKVMITP